MSAESQIPEARTVRVPYSDEFIPCRCQAVQKDDCACLQEFFQRRQVSGELPGAHDVAEDRVLLLSDAEASRMIEPNLLKRLLNRLARWWLTRADLLPDYMVSKWEERDVDGALIASGGADAFRQRVAQLLELRELRARFASIGQSETGVHGDH